MRPGRSTTEPTEPPALSDLSAARPRPLWRRALAWCASALLVASALLAVSALAAAPNPTMATADHAAEPSPSSASDTTTSASDPTTSASDPTNGVFTDTGASPFAGCAVDWRASTTLTPVTGDISTGAAVDNGINSAHGGVLRVTPRYNIETGETTWLVVVSVSRTISGGLTVDLPDGTGYTAIPTPNLNDVDYGALNAWIFTDLAGSATTSGSTLVVPTRAWVGGRGYALTISAPRTNSQTRPVTISARLNATARPLFGAASDTWTPPVDCAATTGTTPVTGQAASDLQPCQVWLFGRYVQQASQRGELQWARWGHAGNAGIEPWAEGTRLMLSAERELRDVQVTMRARGSSRFTTSSFSAKSPVPTGSLPLARYPGGYGYVSGVSEVNLSPDATSYSFTVETMPQRSSLQLSPDFTTIADLTRDWRVLEVNAVGTDPACAAADIPEPQVSTRVVEAPINCTTETVGTTTYVRTTRSRWNLRTGTIIQTPTEVTRQLGYRAATTAERAWCRSASIPHSLTPTTDPNGDKKYVYRVFQVRRYLPFTPAQAKAVAKLDDDRRLTWREDAGLLPLFRRHTLTVRVPVDADVATIAKAINARTGWWVADVTTTARRLTARPWRPYVTVWEIKPGTSAAKASAPTKTASLRYWGRDS